jgi:hypothetical protein
MGVFPHVLHNQKKPPLSSFLVQASTKAPLCVQNNWINLPTLHKYGILGNCFFFKKFLNPSKYYKAVVLMMA